MTTYRIAIARQGDDGPVSLWALDLPGCRAAGLDEADARGLLPVVIADHLAWLSSHGEPVDATTPCDFVFVEDLTSRGEYAFAADREPLTEDDLATAMRHIRYAQADLVTVAGPLPPLVLDWKPPPTSVRIDAIYDDVRSVRQMLGHVTTVESRFYLGSLRDEDNSLKLDAPDLYELGKDTESRLTALTAEQRSRVYKRTTGPRGYWSARKVVRRIVAHKRFHTREIQQRLSWLTLGVPVVLQGNQE